MIILIISIGYLGIVMGDDHIYIPLWIRLYSMDDR